jgi:hypothetical protein
VRALVVSVWEIIIDALISFGDLLVTSVEMPVLLLCFLVVLALPFVIRGVWMLRKKEGEEIKVVSTLFRTFSEAVPHHRLFRPLPAPSASPSYARP